MTTIVQRIEESGYNPTEVELVEYLTLAKNAQLVTSTIEGGYFKILLHRSIRCGSIKDAHKYLYSHVTQVVVTPDMTALERNKATNFARSAYSTLMKASKLGIRLTPNYTKGDYYNSIKSVAAQTQPDPLNAQTRACLLINKANKITQGNKDAREYTLIYTRQLFGDVDNG
jgi:hypothetical protein